jgi:hypothetical protein
MQYSNMEVVYMQLGVNIKYMKPYCSNALHCLNVSLFCKFIIIFVVRNQVVSENTVVVR